MHSPWERELRRFSYAPRVGLFDISEQTVPKELRLSLNIYFTSQDSFLGVKQLYNNPRYAWEAASRTRVPSYRLSPRRDYLWFQEITAPRV